MKIFDMRMRPPFQSIARGMFNSPGREIFLPEVFARRFGMHLAESARLQSMDLFIREMDEAGISMGAVPIRKSTGMDNGDLKKLGELYPGRFVGVGGIDPHDPGCLAEIDACLASGAKAIFIEPGFCKPPLKADNRAIYPIYEKCEAQKIPLFISFGGFVAPDLSYTDPMLIERVALDFPNLQLVLAHGGWPNVNAICHVAFERPGVYLAPDLYTMNVPGNREYIEAANYLIPEKIMFGTAYPCVDMREAVAYYLHWGLNPDIFPDIMFNNAASFLKLDINSAPEH